MHKEDASFERILTIKVDPARIERVKRLVRFDIADLTEEVKDFLISQQLQFVNIQYARFMVGVKFTLQWKDRTISLSWAASRPEGGE